MLLATAKPLTDDGAELKLAGALRIGKHDSDPRVHAALRADAASRSTGVPKPAALAAFEQRLAGPPENAG